MTPMVVSRAEFVEQAVKTAIDNYLIGSAVFVERVGDRVIINVYDEHMLKKINNLISARLEAEKEFISVNYKNSLVEEKEYKSKDAWLSDLGDGREGLGEL